MPQSRNRPGHRYQKPADIPASQRTKGRMVWAVLFSIFGVAMTLFATSKIIVLVIAGIVGAVLGYVIGKTMEQDANRKD